MLTDVFLCKSGERRFMKRFGFSKEDALSTIVAALMICRHCEQEHGRISHVEMRPSEHGIDVHLENGGYFEIREHDD